MPARMKWLQISGIVTGLLIATAAVGLGQSQAPKAPKVNPENKAAMDSLKKASSDLQRAAGGGFGGHREKALDHIKAAEGELKQALEYDKTHPDPVKKKK
jgi:hypothetical protein